MWKPDYYHMGRTVEFGSKIWFYWIIRLYTPGSLQFFIDDLHFSWFLDIYCTELRDIVSISLNFRLIIIFGCVSNVVGKMNVKKVQNGSSGDFPCHVSKMVKERMFIEYGRGLNMGIRYERIFKWIFATFVPTLSKHRKEALLMFKKLLFHGMDQVMH